MKSAGVVGVESLCHPLVDLVDVPKCAGVFSNENHTGLRGKQPLQSYPDGNIVQRNKKTLAEDDDEHDVNFYIVNIGGTIVR